MIKNKRIVFLIIITSLLLVACREEAGPTDEEILCRGDEDCSELIRKRIGEMTLEEKIGQLMIIGFEGWEAEEDIEAKIGQLKPGGVILFKRNVKSVNQLQALINSIKKINKRENNVPLFIALDEEGGDVSRIPKTMKKLPSARELGKLTDYQLLEDFGQLLGEGVSILGFNMNNAPVLDIRSNGDNPITLNRSYNKDGERVAKIGESIIKGMDRSGVISVVKHFPGHGDTSTDSHYNLPIIMKSYEELYRSDLQPFIRAIDMDVQGIMVSHGLYHGLDSKKPATLSKKIITDLLREELGYKNLIISDDMTMGAISNNHEPEKAAVEFIKAGGDLVLLCHGGDIGQVFVEKLREEVEKGNISEEKIDQKLERILRVKEEAKVKDIETGEANIDNYNRKMDQLLERKKESKSIESHIEAGGGGQ